MANGREFIVLPLKHEVAEPEYPLPVLRMYYEYFEDKKKVREFDEDATTAFRDAELSMWSRLWRKPQAVMWSRLGLEDQVAAYVRAYLEATGENSNAGLKTAAIRMETELGISTSGMLQNGWMLESATEGAQKPAVAVKGSGKRQSSSGRWLEAVNVEAANA